MIKYSIIIPTYKRKDLLIRCLNSIMGLHSPKFSHEVLIIDNFGDINCVFESFKDKIPNLRYVFEKNPGLHNARHSGAKNSCGEILCFIDDDSFVDKKWLIEIEKAFLKQEVVLATGKILPEFETHPPEWLKYAWTKMSSGKFLGTLSLADFGEKQKKIAPVFAFGCNFIIRKQTFFDYNGTHPDCMPAQMVQYMGDGETGLAKKLAEKQIKAFYFPEIKVYHYVPESRMTEEYFKNVYFMQGISDSYTQYRTKHGLYKQKSKYLVLSNYFKFFQKFLNSLLNDFIFFFKEDYQKFKKIHANSQKSYNEGRKFHRREVENNPELLKYVLKDNYL
jgi:glucosyl-dolichyl phosphate glucuronosyltransferase